MFLGHFAVGFAAKRAAPKASLGTMIAAACFLDLLWPLFVVAGIEWFRIAPGETVMNPLAFDHYPWSHSLLLTIVWGGVKVGLGLWNTPGVEVPLEFGMYVLGVGLYVFGTKARDRVGTWALWPLVAVLALLHVANLVSPPPPSTNVVAWADLVAAVFLVWAVWADRHRAPRSAGA